MRIFFILLLLISCKTQVKSNDAIQKECSDIESWTLKFRILTGDSVTDYTDAYINILGENKEREEMYIGKNIEHNQQESFIPLLTFKIGYTYEIYFPKANKYFVFTLKGPEINTHVNGRGKRVGEKCFLIFKYENGSKTEFGVFFRKKEITLLETDFLSVRK